MFARISACFALVVVAAPAFGQQVDPNRFVRPYWWDKPVVEALGRAMIEVAPNRAYFGVAYTATDSQSGKAMELASAKAKLVSDAIKKIAGDKASVRSSISMTPYYEQYRDKDGNVIDNRQPDKIRGYEARASIQVTLKDVSIAGRARAAALALGPQSSDAVRFSLIETVDLQRTALAAAAKDARLRAESTAAAAGGKLGELLVLQEGRNPCMGNWSTAQVARVVSEGGGNEYVGSPPPPPPPPPAPAMAPRAMAVASGRVGGRDVSITEDDINRLDLPNDYQPETVQSAVCVVYTLIK